MPDPHRTIDDTTSPLEWLEANESALLATAEELISIESQNPPGETRDIIEYVEGAATDLADRSEQPLDVERIVDDETKPNLLLTLPGRTETTLLYNGHVDTVPYDADAWDHDPLGERVDDRLYGRGATDMKGAVAAMLHTVRAFVRTGTTPPVTLQLAIVSDEETAGSAGLPVLLDRDVLSAEACVIGEPTCEGGRHSITVADKGSIWLTLEASGTAAHGSRPPFGENAIDRLIDAITDLQAHLNGRSLELDDAVAPIVDESVAFYAPWIGDTAARRLFTAPTTNVGTIQGGGTINRVPDVATAEIDVRLTAGVETPSILAELEAIVDGHPSVEIEHVSWSTGTFEPLDSPLVAATADTAEAVVDEPIYRRSATGGGDAKKLRNAGIPTVEFALGTETAHATDEYITREALGLNAAMYTRLPFELARAPDQ